MEGQYSLLLQTAFKPVFGRFLEIKFVTEAHARSIDVLPQNNKVLYVRHDNFGIPFRAQDCDLGSRSTG